MGKVYVSLTSANLLRPSEDRMSYMAKLEKLVQNNTFIHLESIQEGYLAVNSLSQTWEDSRDNSSLLEVVEFLSSVV